MIGGEIGLELGIDRDEPVLAADLHAVAGEEHHGDFGRPRPLAEVDQRAPHVLERPIGDAAHREAETLERRRDVAGIVARVGKDRHVAVGAVADDQSDPRLGGGGSGERARPPPQRRASQASDTN